MNKPDPVQHMMAWGAVSSGLVLLAYFFLIGSFTAPTTNAIILPLLAVGVFTGLSLGGMSGVIIGTVFQHEQAGISPPKIKNRRNAVLIAVFVMVFFITRLLLIMTFEYIEHPLLLAFIGAIVASMASQHYLHRMESWLKKQRKSKRKNDELPQRLLDSRRDEYAQNADFMPPNQQEETM